MRKMPFRIIRKLVSSGLTFPDIMVSKINGMRISEACLHESRKPEIQVPPPH